VKWQASKRHRPGKGRRVLVGIRKGRNVGGRFSKFPKIKPLFKFKELDNANFNRYALYYITID
jgi:hypothetical protein